MVSEIAMVQRILPNRHSFLFVCLAFLLAGCVTIPYKFQGELYPAESPTLEPSEAQISRGEPNVIVDGLGHYLFSLPVKLILWNWRMENHDISPETETAIKQYLEVNQLSDVKVRLNEYAPLSEWTRLTRNEKVGAGWRYTAGVLVWTLYTIFPQRIFGGDNYNPYTDTISVYSDLPVVALHEGGHAKDTGSIEYKGTHSILRILPIVPLFDEEFASSDALSYCREKSDREGEKSGYKLLYPAYGTYVGGQLMSFVPGGTTLGALFAIPGHIVGRYKASYLDEELDSNNQEEVSN